MSSITWQVEFKYTSGGSWVDVTNLVYTNSLKRRWRKHNRLAPTQNTLEFRMHRDVTVINNLLQNDDVEVRVHRAGADYFTGLVRHNFKVTAASNLKPMRVECVDYSERLKERMAWTGAWSNYKVCDTSNTSASIVHQLLANNGTWTATVSTIDRTIPLYVNVDGVDDRTYWDALTEILFQFGYVWDINMSGEFTIYNLFPATTTTSNVFDGANTRGDLTIRKVLEEYDGVEVKWWTQKTETGALVFRDTTGGDSDNDMNVTLANGDTYPGNDSARPFYAEYEYDGAEIIQVTSPSFSYASGTLTQNTFTSSFKRAEIELENATGSPVDLIKFEITGTVTYRDTLNVVRSEDWSTSFDRFEIEARDIYQNSDAQSLATGLKRYFEYSDFEYNLHSETEYEPGAFVDVEEANLGISQRCVIVEQEVVSETTDTPVYYYECEAIEEYVAETTSSEGGHRPSRPVDEEIDDTETGILDEIDDGYDNTGGNATFPGTTTPTVPTLTVQGIFKGYRLSWDRQTNLTNLSHHEMQVSDDEVTWYSLANDGTDWKDAAGLDTDVYDTSFHHEQLPFAGTDDDPQTIDLYYRVRRKTKDGTVSDWSTSVTDSTYLIQIKDLAADSISANKILAGAIVTSKISATALSWPEDAINYWPLDEGSGTTARDVKSGADGTLIGAVSYTSGPGGGAIQTTGVGYLDLGAKTLFADASASWSISFWFSSTTAAILLDNGNVYVEITTSGAIRVVIRGADNNVVGPFNDGSMHNIALSWDRTNAILLVDGGSYSESTTTNLLDDLGASITDTDANSIDPKYKAWEIT